MEQSVKIKQIKKFISSLEKNGMKDDTDIQQALTEKNGFVTLTQI